MSNEFKIKTLRELQLTEGFDEQFNREKLIKEGSSGLADILENKYVPLEEVKKALDWLIENHCEDCEDRDGMCDFCYLHEVSQSLSGKETGSQASRQDIGKFIHHGRQSSMYRKSIKAKKNPEDE